MGHDQDVRGTRKNLIIFGTSASPLTLMHEAIIETMVAHAKKYWGGTNFLAMLLPDGISNYPDKKSGITNQQKKSFLNHVYHQSRWRHNVTLETLLLDTNQPSKIVLTLGELKRKYHKKNILIEELVLFTSAETISNMHQWSGVDVLHTLCNICVFERKSADKITYDYALAKAELEKIGFVEKAKKNTGSFYPSVVSLPGKELSSTYVRDRIAQGDFGGGELLSEAAEEYIKMHQLFNVH